ncbi:hypothetical protein G9A89_016936 [Geosiphon pyriformis]|nr:hypothetical protein G9A89_016936 [Geosiphon pyriformis]
MSSFLSKFSTSIATSTSYSSLSTPINMKLVTALILLFATSNVAAQAHLITPAIRIPKGDLENSLSLVRQPTIKYTCGATTGIAPQIRTHYTAGESIKIEFEIGNALEGNCFIDLSTTGEDTKFQTIGSIPNCGDNIEIFETKLELPKEVTCEQCTLRFRWLPKLSGDVYINCADISISSIVSKTQGKPDDESLQKPTLQRNPCLYNCDKKRSIIPTTVIPIQLPSFAAPILAKRIPQRDPCFSNCGKKKRSLNAAPTTTTITTTTTDETKVVPVEIPSIVQPILAKRVPQRDPCFSNCGKKKRSLNAAPTTTTITTTTTDETKVVPFLKEILVSLIVAKRNVLFDNITTSNTDKADVVPIEIPSTLFR